MEKPNIRGRSHPNHKQIHAEKNFKTIAQSTKHQTCHSTMTVLLPRMRKPGLTNLRLVLAKRLGMDDFTEIQFRSFYWKTIDEMRNIVN